MMSRRRLWVGMGDSAASVMGACRDHCIGRAAASKRENCDEGMLRLPLRQDGHDRLRAASDQGRQRRRSFWVGMCASAAAETEHAACRLPSRQAAKEAATPRGPTRWRLAAASAWYHIPKSLESRARSGRLQRRVGWQRLVTSLLPSLCDRFL
jgi:hypothetical protein